jgi:hypothetical protein
MNARLAGILPIMLGLLAGFSYEAANHFLEKSVFSGDRLEQSVSSYSLRE